MAVLLFSPTFAYDVEIQFSKFHKKVDLKPSLDLKGIQLSVRQIRQLPSFQRGPSLDEAT